MERAWAATKTSEGSETKKLRRLRKFIKLGRLVFFTSLNILVWEGR